METYIWKAGGCGAEVHTHTHPALSTAPSLHILLSIPVTTERRSSFCSLIGGAALQRMSAGLPREMGQGEEAVS